MPRTPEALRATGRGRRRAAVLCLAALVVAAVWLLLRGDEVPEPPAGRSPQPPAPSAAEPDPAPAVAQKPATERRELRVVVRAAIEVPLAASRVRGFYGDDPLTTEVEVVAGVGAAVPERAQGRHLLRVPLPDGRAVLRSVHFPAGGEPVTVTAGGDALLRGRVVAAHDGTPVPDATVWAGVFGGDARRVTTTTDAEGRFLFDAVPTGTGVPVVAQQAPDFADSFVLVDHDRRGSSEPLLGMHRGGDVQVVLAGRITSVEDAVVFAVPAGNAGDAALRHHPFWLPAAWPDAARGASEGGATLRGLPVDVPLQVLVDHPGLPRPASAGCTVRRDRPNRVVVHLPADVDEVTVHGRAVLPDGTPAPGAVVSAEPARGTTLRLPGMLLPPRAHARERIRTQTDSAGRFALAAAPGALRLRAGARGCWTTVRDFAAAGEARDVELVTPPRASDATVDAVPVLTVVDTGDVPVELIAPDGRSVPGGELVLTEAALVDLVDTASGTVVKSAIPVVGRVRIELPPG